MRSGFVGHFDSVRVTVCILLMPSQPNSLCSRLSVSPK